MVHIVIVDDDALALTKLKEIIRIKNVRVTGEFTQASEALEFIKNKKADILITDMKMPKIDGIELIKHAKQYKPDLEIIAVSSYKDFNYVKESFKEGSVDYILKHMLDEESMTNALLEIISRLRKSEKISLEEDVAEESQNALKEKVFSQLFRGELSADKAGEMLQKYKIEMDVGSTILMLCEIDDYASISKEFQAEDKRVFLNAVRNIIERVIARVPEKTVISIQEGRYVVFLSYTDVKSQLYIYSRSSEYARQINVNMKKMMNINVSVSLGKLSATLQNLYDSYEECCEILKNKMFEGKGKIYNNYEKREYHKEKKDRQPVIAFQSGKIYQKLMSADKSCLEDVEEVFQSYKDKKVPQMVIELGVVDMLNTGYKAVEESGLEQIKKEANFHVMYNKIKNLEVVDDIRSIIQKFYLEIIQGIEKNNQINTNNYSKYTIETIKYIQQNYKETISLQELADRMGIHYAYLSKLFKQDTGVNFGEYLNRIRIEKAKELIRDGRFRIKEVYAEVGFNQYNYFFKVFKQLEGCTPLEYDKTLK